ncbi:BrnT family toxin [Candidatus Thiosymbion oneisti]|uniref:BrnT family toxin n=1 Tax=Candidatus Thiosymbion oneisti TaxID=589554 RepID=UPI000ADD0D1E|nr:BrnT family toxin [Candidatus Thiosymbion oneisti]
MIKFEFDESKGRPNLEKHGIDFYTAQELWNDPDLIEIPANTSDEPNAIKLVADRLSWSIRMRKRKRQSARIGVKKIPPFGSG